LEAGFFFVLWLNGLTIECNMSFTFKSSHAVMFFAGVFLTLGISHGDRILSQIDFATAERLGVKSSAALALSLGDTIEREVDKVPFGFHTEPTRAEELSVIVTSSEARDGEIKDSKESLEDLVVWESGVEWPESAFRLPKVQVAITDATPVKDVVTQTVSADATTDLSDQVATTPAESDAQLDHASVEISHSEVGQSSDLPEGIFQLPSGQYVDINGNLISGDPIASGNYVPTSPVNEYFETPGGIILDRFGNIVSIPKKEEEALPDPTEINLTSLPEYGSSIYIPNYIIFKVNLNPSMSCSQHQFFNNDLALCELYQNQEDDYQWEVIQYE
jgi:hypothetical protein